MRQPPWSVPSVLGEWAQSLNRRTHAGDIAGTTAHTYYAIVSACLSWAGKWEYLEGNPALKQRANDELSEPSAGETRVYRCESIFNSKVTVHFLRS